MPLKLRVPFAEKDIAKKKGAFWDTTNKIWFVPNNKNFNEFLSWIDTTNIQIILKSPAYLAKSSRQCWKCHQETNLVSLYSINFYSLECENESDEESDEKVFQKVDVKSFFSNVTYLDQDISNFLLQNFKFFKIGFSKTIGANYWANHCEHCNALQGDFFNHSQPGGAFFPTTEEECRGITLIKLPLEFDIGLSGDFSLSSNEDEVYKLTEKVTWDPNHSAR